MAAVVGLAAASAALEPLRYQLSHPLDPSRLKWDVSVGKWDVSVGDGSFPFVSVDRSTLKRNVHRDYDLSKDKAQAVFDLLAPSDVRVIVGKREGGISIKGTPWEVGLLDRFVELIKRKQGQDKETVRDYIDQSLEFSDTHETYRLPPRKREALHRILAFDDVPVRVDRDPGRRVSVRATAEDQETLGGVVEILRGNRSWHACNGIRCWLGWHSSRCQFPGRDALIKAEATARDAILEAKVLVEHGLHHAETVMQQIEMPVAPDAPVRLRGIPHPHNPDHPHDCPGCK